MWGIFSMALHSFWHVDLIVLTPYVLALPKASIRGSTELGTQNPLASDITLWWGRWERGWVLTSIEARPAQSSSQGWETSRVLQPQHGQVRLSS